MFFVKLCDFPVALCVIAISQSCAENLKVAQSFCTRLTRACSVLHTLVYAVLRETLWLPGGTLCNSYFTKLRRESQSCTEFLPGLRALAARVSYPWLTRACCTCFIPWLTLFFMKLCDFPVALCVIAISQSCAENLKVAQNFCTWHTRACSACFIPLAYPRLQRVLCIILLPDTNDEKMTKWVVSTSKLLFRNKESFENQ